MQMLKEPVLITETYASSNSIFGQGILSRKWLKSQISIYNAYTMQTINSLIWKYVNAICQPSAIRE